MSITEMYPKKVRMIKKTIIILWDIIIGTFIPTFYGWVTYQLYLSTIEVPFSESNTLMVILIVFGIGGVVGMGAFIHAVGEDIVKESKRFMKIYRS